MRVVYLCGEPRKVCCGTEVASCGPVESVLRQQAVQNWPVPHNARMLRSLLGCVPTTTVLSVRSPMSPVPCMNCVRKKKPFKWNKECNDLFQLLKSALVSSPVLAYPRNEETFLLDNDGVMLA